MTRDDAYRDGAAQRDDDLGGAPARSSTCSRDDAEVDAVARRDDRLAACFDLNRRARQRRPHLRRPRRARTAPADVRMSRRGACRTTTRGKVRDALRGRPRPHARGRLRPRLGVRRRARPTSSPTRAGCSPRCRRSGSSRPPTSCPTTCVVRPHRLPRDRRARRRRPGDAGARGASRCAWSASPAATCSARAWSEYQETGTVKGRPLPAGLRQAERLPEPIFTPTTKAEPGHDLPLTDAEAAELVGADRYEQLRDLTLAIYEFGAAHAADARAHPRRHEARVRRDRRRAHGDRRDADPRLVARTGAPTSTRSARRRRRSTSSTCATTTCRSGGTRRHRRRACPTA